MNKIINEENIDNYRTGNLYEAVKSTFLDIIETIHPNILTDNKLNEEKLEQMVIAVSDNDEVNDYIDGRIHEQIDKFMKENQIEEEEENEH